MKSRELFNLGLPRGPLHKTAGELIAAAVDAGLEKRTIRAQLRSVISDPDSWTGDLHFGELARALLKEPRPESFVERDEAAPWKQWGTNLESQSVEQMDNACRLPVAVAGALMPDAHLGYGLPIGGVLATDKTVIPYAVGVDIACRMRLSVFDIPPHAIKSQPDRLINVLESETRFGIGAQFRNPRDHSVMENDWSITPLTEKLHHKAWSQLGTSGSGNHFVEYGTLTLSQDDLGLEAGVYLALLSHSGSRGAGAAVAQHYSRLAMDLHSDLPKSLRHLAWLDLDSEAGQEYWAAMQLMGEYAAANHELIHRHMARSLGAEVLATVENHHNFAWKEHHRGSEVIVHRKGATPADEGVLGVIPGSMATPGYVVRGRGNAESLNSASHGAGRVMSRRKARESFTWSQAKKLLTERGVQLLSAGLDEVPMVYKDIDDVMFHQRDLVDTVARFDPRIVKMAPAGERPED